MSLPLPQGYVAVHVAQPSATYVHSVRCSERHRSERLLVRLFVLACACVCVCVLQRACASVCTCVCTIARCCAQVASACGAASCSMHLHAQLCQRAMHKSVVCEQCVKQRIVGLRFRKFFFPCVRTMANKQQHASGRCALQARFVVQHCGKSHSQNGEASSARVVAHCRAAKTKCALLHTSTPMKQRLRQQCLRTLSRIST